MKTKHLGLLITLLLGASNASNGQGTAFSYTGHLADNGNPANGLYNLRFAIFDSASAGNQIGPTLINYSMGVSNGLFTVTLNFGSGVFTGPSRWLEIGVRTNGSATFTTLDPRQHLTPTPYAILAGNISGVVAASSLSGAYSGALALTNAANSFRGAFSGNGAGLTNVNAASLGGQTPSNFWQTAGNLNATAGTHFLGTRDNQPLEVRVNNSRVARFEPGANITLGNAANFINAGVVGSTIAGGRFNTNSSSDSVISGGRDNQIDTAASLSSIGGGWLNAIQVGADQSVIGGGNAGTIEPGARESFIGGGFANTMAAGGILSFIGSGTRNTNGGYASSIVGGQVNVIAAGADNGVISGGTGNTIVSNAVYATIPGGRSNSATNYAFAAGRRAKAVHQGAFVWADSQNADFGSTDADQFAVRAQGGARFVTDGAGLTLDDAVGLTASAGAGRLELRNTNAALRALIQGGPAAGSLTLYRADGGNGAILEGHNNFGDSRLTLYERNGKAGVSLYTSETSGAALTLHQWDGLGTRAGRPFTTVGSGHLWLFNTEYVLPTVEIQAYQNSVGDGGYIRMYNGDGAVNTVEIDAQRTASGGGYIGLRNAGDTRTIELDANNGTVTTQVIEITGGADFSEHFDIAGDTHEPGMIVSIDPANPGRLVLSSSAYDKKVAGIISGAGGVRPGMLMGQRGSVADGKHPVALTGRVYCWVDADANGAVEPGDMLTTSNTAGHGMKASDTSRATGAIIGKAMTGLGHGKGLVLVLVNLQ